MREGFKSKSYAGFTLVELLIACVVIGILARVIMVNLNAAREKARLARLIHFESQVDHGLGPALVAEWTFDDLNTNQLVVKDLSTRGNDLNVCNDTSVLATNCNVTLDCYPPVNSGQCVAVTGMGQCFDTSITTAPGSDANPAAKYFLSAYHSSSLSTANPATPGMTGGKNITIGLWIKLQPNSAGVYYTPTTYQILVQKWREYGLVLYGGDTVKNKIKLEYHKSAGGDGFYDHLFFNTKGVPADNKWHYIVGVWDNTHGKYGAFLDGAKEVLPANGSFPYTDPVVLGSLSVGRRGGTDGTQTCVQGLVDPFWTGLIDRVRVYNDALSI